MQTTEGWLLNRLLRYEQPADGYRTGIEPVLLAASIPARPGDRVLEAGTGAGAALMCLASRVPGLTGTGVEKDPDMAALAQRNIAANSLPDLTIIAADLAEVAGLGPFDHVFANPPWHDPAGTQSPVSRRRTAKLAAGENWGALLRGLIRPGGSATLLVPAAQTGEAMASLRPGCVTLMPLWPKAGQLAKLVVVQARARRGPDRVLPGLVLHAQDGAFSAAAEAVLREGGGLVL